LVVVLGIDPDSGQLELGFGELLEGFEVRPGQKNHVPFVAVNGHPRRLCDVGQLQDFLGRLLEGDVGLSGGDSGRKTQSKKSKGKCLKSSSLSAVPHGQTPFLKVASLIILKHSRIDIKDPIRIVIASFVFGAKAAGRITIHLAEKIGVRFSAALA
jgi:hypothetical protein